MWSEVVVGAEHSSEGFAGAAVVLSFTATILSDIPRSDLKDLLDKFERAIHRVLTT